MLGRKYFFQSFLATTKTCFDLINCQKLGLIEISLKNFLQMDNLTFCCIAGPTVFFNPHPVETI